MATKFLLANRVRVRAGTDAEYQRPSRLTALGSIVEIAGDGKWIGIWWDDEDRADQSLVLADLYDLA